MLSFPSRQRVGEKLYNNCPFPLEIQPEAISPQEFCRRMFGISGLPETHIKLYENQRNYRQECIELLSFTLDVNPNTVKNWGINFDKMPYTYQRILGVYYERLKLIRDLQEFRQSQPDRKLA